jgi:hypothetical protein
MSDLLNSASLVLIPSGYKEDVVYSAVPTDGSGDLSFTRASNGTRINSAGLVEVCPWNLLQQSEAFSNTSIWNVLNGASVSANTAVAPNGTTTADTLTFSTNASSNVFCYPSAPIGKINVSVYAKTASGTKEFALRVDLPGGTTSPNFTATTEWQRFDFEVTTTVANLVFYIINGSSATAGSIFIWGAQLNIGSTAKPYFPTTDRLNVPRLTYQNGGGGCPSLLLEKQSTNLVTYSEQFDNAAWIKGNSTITANTAISPDGTQNADLLVDDTVNTEHNISNIVSITSNAISTFSIYLKSGTQKYAMLRHYADNQQYYCVVVDLDSGTITKTQAGTSTNNTSSSITNVGNGWYRVTATCSYSTTSVYAILQMVNSATPSIGTYGQNTYLGNGTNSINVWGAQLEASSYPTSYINTTSASATRVVDKITPKSLSSVGITSNYTFYFQLGECNISAAESWILQASSGANTPFQIYGTTAILYTSTGYLYPFSFLSTNPNNNKVAVSYDGTNIKVFWNGAKMGQWTATSEWANLTTLDLSYGISTQIQYKEVVLFNVGLSDADGISLTTI